MCVLGGGHFLSESGWRGGTLHFILFTATGRTSINIKTVPLPDMFYNRGRLTKYSRIWKYAQVSFVNWLLVGFLYAYGNILNAFIFIVTGNVFAPTTWVSFVSVHIVNMLRDRFYEGRGHIDGRIVKNTVHTVRYSASVKYSMWNIAWFTGMHM